MLDTKRLITLNDDEIIKILTENNSKEFINYLYKELYS